MTFNDNFNSITLPYLMKKVVETINKTNVFASLILATAKPWKGRTLDRSIQISAPSTGGSFSGLDTFQTVKSNTKVRMSYDLRAEYQSIVVEGLERDVAGVDSNAAVDYVAEIMEEAGSALAQRLGTKFYGDGTGNGSKDILGLKAVVDDGSTVAVLGGLNRQTTYTTLQSYKASPGVGLVSLAPIYTALNATEVFANEVGKKVILTTRALWNNIESLMAPTIVSNVQADGYKVMTRNGSSLANRDGLKGEQGFNALYLRGVPVIADEKCTTNYLYILDMDYLNWFGIKDAPEGYRNIMVGGNSEIEGNEPAKSIGAIFTNFIKPINQYGEVGHIIVRGNMVTFNPNRHGVIIYT